RGSDGRSPSGTFPRGPTPFPPPAARPARCSRSASLSAKNHSSMRPSYALTGRGENGLPVALHAHQSYAVVAGLVECFRERTQSEVAVIRELALGVIVMEQEREPCAASGDRVAHHREVAVGVPESQDRPSADMKSDVLDLHLPIVEAAEL